MDVYGHLFIVSLDECDDFVQSLFVSDVLKYFRDEKIENSIWIVLSIDFRDLFTRFACHIMECKWVSSEPERIWNLGNHFTIIDGTDGFNLKVSIPFRSADFFPNTLIQRGIITIAENMFVRQDLREILNELNEWAFGSGNDILNQLFVNDPENEPKRL